MSKIILKKSSVTSKVPLVTDLDYGELALNYADGKLFYKNSSNVIDYVGSATALPSQAGNSGKVLSTNGTVLSWVDLPSSSSVGAALQNRSSAAATSGQTTFAITYTAPYVDVFKNGVRLSPGTDYTATNGTSIVLATGAILGDLIECVGYNTLIAGTINYNDLYNKPTLFSGSYADLTNKPTIDTLVPSQTGNSGKYLTTNGTTVSWATVSGGGGSSAYSNQYSINGTTTDATETEIFIGGTANTRIAVPTNKNVYYTVDIIARETGGGTNYGAFTLKSVAANSSTGVVSDLGNMYEVIIARSSVNIAVDIRADNTNKTINLYVTGLAGVTLSWKAVVTTVEV